MKNQIFVMILGAALIVAPFAFAGPPPAAQQADVVFLGELHDNPTHHRVQAQWVAALAPSAIVFEMLTPEKAEAVTPENRRSETALESVLEWEEAGWPDFSMYFPIFEASRTAAVFGAALPRQTLRPIMSGEFSVAFDPKDVARFSLNEPLDATEQEKRLALQARAHCDALPENLLPGMISVQRARDAALAAAAIEAFEAFGGPVVVITGNGHARRDWGAPTALSLANSELSVFALGQAEEGIAPEGAFDLVVDAPAVKRGDPCEMFKK